MSLISTMFSDYAQAIRPAIGQDSAEGTTEDYTPGDSGVTVLFSGVPCSYQEASANIQLYYQQRDMNVTNEVWFSQDPGDLANCQLVVTRVRTGDTLTLNVRGVRDPVQLGQTWVWKVDAERVRLPA